MNRWTSENIEILRQQAENFTQKQLAKTYGVKEDAMYKVLTSNNITPVPDVTTREKWTEEEIETLISFAPTHYAEDISPIVHKSVQRIMTMAKNLNIVVKVKGSYLPWTADEVLKLKELSNTKYSDEIASLLKRNEYDVRLKADELGIKLIFREAKSWTGEEEVILRNCVKAGLDISKISERLHRSVKSIYNKAERLGLKINRAGSIPWSERDIELLKIFSCDFTPTELASIFEKSRSSVRNKLKRFNLSSLQAEEMDTSTNINNILDNKRRLLEMERQALLDHKDTLEKTEDKQL